jgi:hypothetical protein
MEAAQVLETDQDPNQSPGIKFLQPQFPHLKKKKKRKIPFAF